MSAPGTISNHFELQAEQALNEILMCHHDDDDDDSESDEYGQH
jgi:hypothetical protein